MTQPNRRINRNSNQFRGINNILGGAGTRNAPASGSAVGSMPRSAPRPDLGVRAGTARIDKENRLRRGRDTGNTQHTNLRANVINPATVLREKKIPQIPVTTTKRKRGNDEDEAEQPLKKRPASDASRVEEAAPAHPAPELKSRPMITTDEIRRRTDELRRKRLESASSKNCIREAAVTQPDHNTTSGPQKKVDEMRKKHKQKTANIKSRTAKATPTTQQQDSLPSPPSSTGTSPVASLDINGQRDFTEDLKQAKLKRIAAEFLPTPNESKLKAAPLPSSDTTHSKTLALPDIETSPISIFSNTNATFNLVSTMKFEHTFDIFDYTDSVPIIFSCNIHHNDDVWDIYTSNDALMANALCLIYKGKEARQIGLSSAPLPLGREGELDRSLPTKVIDDVDLYMRHADSKIYVASEQGLLLAASYLTLIGVPSAQPVKFNGHIPLWAKAADYERHSRRVMDTFEVKNPDELSVSLGSIIAVHRIRDDGMAFCRSPEGDMGWFPYKLTGETNRRFVEEKPCTPINEPKQKYPEWDGVFAHLLYPGLVSDDDTGDLEDKPVPQKPVSRFREGSSAKVPDSKAPKSNALNPNASEFKASDANSPNPPAIEPAVVAKRLEDVESRMAELRAKIKASTETKKAAQKASEATAATKTLNETHTEVQKALTAIETPGITPCVEAFNVIVESSCVPHTEGAEATAVPEAKMAETESTIETESNAAAELIVAAASTIEAESEAVPEPEPEPGPEPGPEPEPTVKISAFDKPRLNPWECGVEDFVDWDDDEL